MQARVCQPAGRMAHAAHEAHLVGALVHGEDESRRGMRSVAVVDSLDNACSVVGENCYVDKKSLAPAVYSENGRGNFSGMVLKGAVVPEYEIDKVGVPERLRGKKVFGSVETPMGALIEQAPQDALDGLRIAIDDTVRNVDEAALAAERAQYDSHQMAAAIEGVPAEDVQSRRGILQHEEGRHMAAVLKHSPLDALELQHVASDQERNHRVSNQVAAVLQGVPEEVQVRRVVLAGEENQSNSHQVAAAIYGVPEELAQRRRGMHQNEDSSSVARALNGVPMTPEFRRKMLQNDNSNQVAMAIRGAPFESVPQARMTMPTGQISHLVARGDGVGQLHALVDGRAPHPVQSSRPHPLSSYHAAGANRQTGPSGALLAVGSMVASPRAGVPVIQTDPDGLRLPPDRARLLHHRPP